MVDGRSGLEIMWFGYGDRISDWESMGSDVRVKGCLHMILGWDVSLPFAL